MIQLAEHADHGSGINRTPGALVIETHIPAGDGSIQRDTGFTHAVNTLFKHIINFRLIRIPEVQAISDSQRFCSAASHIPGTFGDGCLGTFKGVKIAIATVTVSCRSDCDIAITKLEHRSITAGFNHCSNAHHMVILPKDVSLGSNIRSTHQSVQNLVHILRMFHAAEVEVLQFVQMSRAQCLPLINGSFPAQNEVIRGDLRLNSITIFDSENLIIGSHADLNRIEIPLCKNIYHVLNVLRLNDN